MRLILNTIRKQVVVLSLGFFCLGVTGATFADPPTDAQIQICVACHMKDGNSTVTEYPKLAGISDTYLRKQLRDFKKGKRKNATMSGIVATLDSHTMKNLAEYFSEQEAKDGKALNPDLVAKGKNIFDEGIGNAVPACSNCHNTDGSGDDKYPRLAGQHQAYVVSQIENFKSGVRNNDSKGVMSAVAKRMETDDMIAVAEYIATLKVEEDE